MERPSLPDPADLLRAAGHLNAADRLDADRAAGLLHDVDIARLTSELLQLTPRATDAGTTGLPPGPPTDTPPGLGKLAEQVLESGATALVHSSGQRDLPERVTRHQLELGQVRVGVATAEPRNPRPYRKQPFGLDTDVLCTSLLVVGPPGSGKTRSFALPVLEHLCLQALANNASVLTIDPKGEFAKPGMFDVDIDPASPDNAWGFDLYGGAPTPEEAADRLASAVLPPGVSADKAYFLDASRNALYQALAPFHAAYDGRYPTVKELLGMVEGDDAVVQSVRDRLRHNGLLGDYERLLAARERQRSRRDDPAASLVERLGLLDRPSLVRLFDEQQPRFAMRDLNRPLRVRLALPEAQYPDASLILARLAVAQFVQVASATDANRTLFKGLLVDEAGRYVDDYVARGVQRLRASNAGLVLLTQSLGDFPDDLRQTIFGSTGCKAVFAGLDPADASYLADWWGTRWVADVTLSARQGESRSVTPGRQGVLSRDEDRETHSTSSSMGTSVHQVERPLWSPSEIINDVPPGHALISLARSDGTRTPPVLVNLRA